ncbi:hypothetical protein TVAG_193750 [Trichomonas vaginalis G3]|uniref:Uncharacterized protein n=1 Tax=Trichomonas vaginalis (strain ATCC PRA-98 / G3) TaxID=412133 RepID=A2EVM6_TRIV3|nr:hypothetical protein TVAG_193750 [Trichomonas vaginalis G3]|eukprot:XP_001315528.1 hypothetical protein [Trichomonas vaginalis G3]
MEELINQKNSMNEDTDKKNKELEEQLESKKKELESIPTGAKINHHLLKLKSITSIHISMKRIPRTQNKKRRTVNFNNNWNLRRMNLNLFQQLKTNHPNLKTNLRRLIHISMTRIQRTQKPIIRTRTLNKS